MSSLLTGLSSLEDLELDNQRVFVRADLDAPLNRAGEIIEDFRIRAALPTLQALLKTGARVLVGARLGEAQLTPGSLSPKKAPSIEVAAARLAELLQVEVLVPDACTGDSVKKVMSSLREGQICVLENLAQDDDVGPGAEAFARNLLEYIDMYVADAPRALSLQSATTTILPRLVEQRVVGFNLLKELESLNRIRVPSDGPRLFIWGGSTLSEHLPLLHRLLGPQDRVFFAGVPANTILSALRSKEPGALGRSPIEESYLAGARTLRDQLESRWLLPSDFLVGESFQTTRSRVCSVDEVSPHETVLDLGPRSLEALREQIEQASSVIWCGAASLHKNANFAEGHRTILEALAQTSAFTIILGEDSVSVAHSLGADLLEKIDCVSQGGAASFSLLSANKLAGLEALRGISHDTTNPPDRR